jgi:hypothetical protein
MPGPAPMLTLMLPEEEEKICLSLSSFAPIYRADAPMAISCQIA